MSGGRIVRAIQTGGAPTPAGHYSHYSLGYSGHGTQMSTLMGTIMAEVMDGRAELNPWKDFTWPAIPGHFGPPWFLPLVGAYYRLKDKLA